MKRTLLLLLPTLMLVGLAGRADAQSRSSHERIKATAIKRQGATVGLRLKMTLRPTGDHTNVRIGLGPGDTTYANDYRDQAADPGKGYLLHQFAEITDLKPGEPKEVTLEVMYKDAPKLTPGQKGIEVISAWNNKDHNSSYWHVWGMQKAQVDASSVIDLPGSPEELAKAEAGGGPAAASTAARSRARARTRTSARAASRLSASRQSAARSRATRSRTAARARRAAQTRSRTQARTRARSSRVRAR